MACSCSRHGTCERVFSTLRRCVRACVRVLGLSKGEKAEKSHCSQLVFSLIYFSNDHHNTFPHSEEEERNGVNTKDDFGSSVQFR